MQIRARGIEGRVAKVSGGSPILGFGANDGVEYGDRFEILKIVSEAIDPTTKEVLDLETAKVGEFVMSNVRERTATGYYGGQPYRRLTPRGTRRGSWCSDRKADEGCAS